jgi:hypothetical protein
LYVRDVPIATIKANALGCEGVVSKRIGCAATAV